MNEAELIAAAKEIAEGMKAVPEKAPFSKVEYIDEGDLDGEPASIMVELPDGRQFVLGVLPL
jgi:hypothetical protein